MQCVQSESSEDEKTWDVYYINVVNSMNVFNVCAFY